MGPVFVRFKHVNFMSGFDFGDKRKVKISSKPIRQSEKRIRAAHALRDDAAAAGTGHGQMSL